ncbi:MAG: hypothetical protein LBQ76_08495 [Candidatus Fibromonas sp.]|nr:hypothetical protein [Candidatus Fibromonas sp.]
MTLQQVVDSGMAEIRAIDEAVEKAVEKGVKKGVKKGIAKGIAKAERRILKQGVAIGMEKVFALLEKGMSLAEAKKKLSISN